MHKSLIPLLTILMLASVLTLNAQPVKKSPTNPCGVTAVITPGNDSVVTVSTTINLSSASINATSYKFFADNIPLQPNTPFVWTPMTGLTEIKLVAYNGNCTDTARCYYFYPGQFPPDTNDLRMYYGSPAINEYVTNFIRVKSGGFLIAGQRKDNSYSYTPTRGYIIKTKSSGCIEWSLMFDSSNHYSVESKITEISEAPDGSFYLAGRSESNQTFFAKISSSGNLLWGKRLDPVGWMQVSYSGIKAMPDNGLVITGQAGNDKYQLIRLDAAGNILWHKKYDKPVFNSSGLRNILKKDGYLYIGGPVSYNENNTYYNHNLLMKVDYSTGETIWTKSYSVPGGVIYSQDMYDSDTTILINSIISTGIPGSYTITSLLRVDTSGAVISTKIISESQPYGINGSRLVPLPSKNYYVLSYGYITLPLQPYISYQTKMVKLDSSFNVLWAKHHAAINLGQYFYAEADDDETLVMAGNETGFTHEYYSSMSAKIVIRKIDSSGQQPFTECLLYDQPTTSSTQQIQTEAFVWTVDVAVNEPVYNYNVHAYSFYPQLRYRCPDYIDSCSFFKISGPASVCNYSAEYTYKSHKNKGCGQPVQWIVPSGVSVVQQTDSAITVRFPGFGNYTVAGKLSFGCSPLYDSVKVTVNSTTPPVNLGSDTSICFNNTKTLHAGSYYLTYEWQDGSTDSLFTVNTPGLFWVRVTDSCGNILRDSITITAAAPVPISLGPDRTMCSRDTVQLNAPTGFLNYTWQPNYNISSTTAQNVVVSPAADTVYTIKAEKTPGCFGFDSVRITVNQSPPINLGTDKSFCSGDSAVLNAGNGFSQYLWNNGSTSQQLTVHNQGLYIVTGTTAQGCTSKDSLQVLQVFALPAVTLNPDSTLCTGTTRILDAGSGYVSYYWNNGSTTQNISINSMGLYAVQVTDYNGCKGTDTTTISRILPLPSGFLGPDTAICSYGNLQLKAQNVYNRYLWSNGSSSSSITVTKPGVYWLQATDRSNCTGKDSITVNPKECLKGFYMPTGFTPNNDGKNDLLKPILLGNILQYRFLIYNRWGQLVFEATNPEKGWNGVYKDAVQDGNVYVWLCNYQLEGEQPKTAKGTVVVIR